MIWNSKFYGVQDKIWEEENLNSKIHVIQVWLEVKLFKNQRCNETSILYNENPKT